MSVPTKSNKLIAKAAAAAFGTKPSVHRYWDEQGKASVDILSCTDSPWQGVTSYATLGVSDIPIMIKGKEIDVRAELVGGCRSEIEIFGNCLAATAFGVIRSGWFIAPGVVLLDMLSQCDEWSAMKHLLLLPPFLWGEKLKTLYLGDKKVTWLLVVPISQQELKFSESAGVPELENLFEDHQIDIFNLSRESVV